MLDLINAIRRWYCYRGIGKHFSGVNIVVGAQGDPRGIAETTLETRAGRCINRVKVHWQRRL